ncbi:hypothetical protein MYX07_04530 [Patescibacteria group bacterium AH-259-L07]|nr:hypothetical protein [Patescibacteria group bacterium AH-259-L07]
MREVYFVYIIHQAIEDYGKLGSALAQLYIAKHGQKAFDKLQKKIREYWELVEETIDEKIPNVEGLIIYQNEFPVSDRERVLAHLGEMLKDFSESCNFKLLKKLLGKGAILEGTEDANLVMRQWEIDLRVAQTPSLEEQQRIRDETAELTQQITKKRDVSIAKRIRDTLPEDGKAILFIGRRHDVIAELAKFPEKFLVTDL